MTLTPYPEYKDSGVEWLGEIPAHWHRNFVKQSYDVVLGKMLQNSQNHAQDVLVPYLRAVNVQWFTLKLNLSNMWASSEEIRKYSVKDGDLLVCEGGEGGRCTIAVNLPENCIIQNAVHRVRARFDNNEKYLGFILYTVSKLGWLDAINNKATIAHFTHEKFQSLPIPLPPPDEQAAIVRFLDAAEKHIRRYIRAKQKLIHLLNEQKQAIIQQAVTRGLDPDAPMKDSGVEWLGEIPAHWEVLPLKRVVQIQTGITLGKTYLSETREYPYLRVANVQTGYVDLSHIKTINVPPNEAARSMLRVGDVLMTEGGDADKLGRGTVWNGEIPECLHQNHIFAVRPDMRRLLPQFLEILLSMYYARIYFILSSKQTTNLASTNQTTIGMLPIVLPSLEEQKALIGLCDKQVALIQGGIDSITRDIELAREYQTRLIADVVTGKVDVRGLAFEMPEAFEEDDLLDVDEDDLLEDDELEEAFDGED